MAIDDNTGMFDLDSLASDGGVVKYNDRGRQGVRQAALARLQAYEEQEIREEQLRKEFNELFSDLFAEWYLRYWNKISDADSGLQEIELAAYNLSELFETGKIDEVRGRLLSNKKVNLRSSNLVETLCGKIGDLNLFPKREVHSKKDNRKSSYYENKVEEHLTELREIVEQLVAPDTNFVAEVDKIGRKYANPANLVNALAQYLTQYTPTENQDGTVTRKAKANIDYVAAAMQNPVAFQINVGQKVSMPSKVRRNGTAVEVPLETLANPIAIDNMPIKIKMPDDNQPFSDNALNVWFAQGNEQEYAEKCVMELSVDQYCAAREAERENTLGKRLLGMYRTFDSVASRLDDKLNLFVKNSYAEKLVERAYAGIKIGIQKILRPSNMALAGRYSTVLGMATAGLVAATIGLFGQSNNQQNQYQPSYNEQESAVSVQEPQKNAAQYTLTKAFVDNGKGAVKKIRKDVSGESSSDNSSVSGVYENAPVLPPILGGRDTYIPHIEPKAPDFKMKELQRGLDSVRVYDGGDDVYQHTLREQTIMYDPNDVASIGDLPRAGEGMNYKWDDNIDTHLPSDVLDTKSFKVRISDYSSFAKLMRTIRMFE